MRGRHGLLTQGRREGLGMPDINILPRNEEHVNEMQISLYCPQLRRFCLEGCWILRVYPESCHHAPQTLPVTSFPRLVLQFQQFLAGSQPQPLPSHLWA